MKSNKQAEKARQLLQKYNRHGELVLRSSRGDVPSQTPAPERERASKYSKELHEMLEFDDLKEPQGERYNELSISTGSGSFSLMLVQQIHTTSPKNSIRSCCSHIAAGAALMHYP